jgi:hypothetical protein
MKTGAKLLEGKMEGICWFKDESEDGEDHGNSILLGLESR